MDQGAIQLLIFIVFIIIGYTAGSAAESRHYKSILTRENKYLMLPVLTCKTMPPNTPPVADARLVIGSAVISIDYFKRFLAGLRGFFGGEISAYESLIDRARREAILRMKEMAPGADLILNLRIETSSISQSTEDNNIGSIEAIAYATAIIYKRTS